MQRSDLAYLGKKLHHYPSNERVLHKGDIEYRIQETLQAQKYRLWWDAFWRLLSHGPCISFTNNFAIEGYLVGSRVVLTRLLMRRHGPRQSWICRLYLALEPSFQVINRMLDLYLGIHCMLWYCLDIDYSKNMASFTLGLSYWLTLLIIIPNYAPITLSPIPKWIPISSPLHKSFDQTNTQASRPHQNLRDQSRSPSTSFPFYSSSSRAKAQSPPQSSTCKPTSSPSFLSKLEFFP